MIRKLFKIKLEFDVLSEELEGVPGGDYVHPDNGRLSLEWYERQLELQKKLLADRELLKRYVLTRVTELLDSDSLNEINKLLNVDPLADQAGVSEEMIDQTAPETAAWFRSPHDNGSSSDNMELVTLSFSLKPTAIDIVDA